MKKNLAVDGVEGDKIISVRRWKDSSHVFLIFNFNSIDVKFASAFPKGTWVKILDSSEKMWNGPGSLLTKELDPEQEIIIKGHSLVLYRSEKP